MSTNLLQVRHATKKVCFLRDPKEGAWDTSFLDAIKAMDYASEAMRRLDERELFRRETTADWATPGRTITIPRPPQREIVGGRYYPHPAQERYVRQDEHARYESMSTPLNLTYDWIIDYMRQAPPDPEPEG